MPPLTYFRRARQRAEVPDRRTRTDADTVTVNAKRPEWEALLAGTITEPMRESIIYSLGLTGEAS